MTFTTTHVEAPPPPPPPIQPLISATLTLTPKELHDLLRVFNAGLNGCPIEAIRQFKQPSETSSYTFDRYGLGDTLDQLARQAGLL